MSYLKQTKDLVLTLEIDGLNIFKWFIDASHAVHNDMKSHTGGTLMLGKGAAYSKSTKQKINTKSSTEGEIVGVDDILPQVLWTNFFMRTQGYSSKETIVYQDNKSTILLEENGKKRSGRRTRHLNIRYFFLTDQIEKGNISIQYCPTDEMIGDYMNKPLQGEKFRKFRKDILNLRE